MSKDLLSVFKRVSTVTNEKIDRVLDDVRALPQNLPHVPGIDLTAGGEYLTYDEAVKLKSKQSGLTTQMLALKAAFASVNCLILNKNVYYELSKALKLYRIYPPKPYNNNTYYYHCEQNAWVVLDYLKRKAQVREELVSEFVKRILFPDYKVADKQSDAGVSGIGLKFSIKVISPPEQVRKKIIETMSLVSENLTKDNSTTICTLADENAFQVEGLEIPPAPLLPLDPGVVLERGDYAVILTDTFYHVSDLEQQFLDKAEQVAENWQVKQFLLN